MNIKLVISSLMVLTVQGCANDPIPQAGCGQTYYHYDGKNIFLYKSKDKALIGFVRGTTLDEAKQILFRWDIIKSIDHESSATTDFMLVNLNENSTCDEISNGLLLLYANPKVLFANQTIYQSTPSDPSGFTNKFIVGLKSVSDTTQLNLMMKMTQTSIAMPSFDPLSFTLMVGKSSNLDALEMANIFFETGRFRYAEPDFVTFNAFN